MLVIAELALRDRAGEERAGSAAVFEERAALERLVFGLIVHVLPAANSDEEQRGVRHLSAQLHRPPAALGSPGISPSLLCRIAGPSIRCTGRTGFLTRSRSALH